jgi:methylthioribulose-1-phosphate dehydratase
MANEFDALEPRDALVKIAAIFYARGWMYGTAGNLSRRTGENTFWITASGKPKGQLTSDDFIQYDIARNEICSSHSPALKPSAETSIHQAIYALFPEAKACLHVHSVDACIATNRFADKNILRLPTLEMIKGFNIWQQEPDVCLDVFDNHLNVPEIAADILDFYKNQSPALSALMIRNHGITVWGESLQQAFNRVEIAEFIFSYLARIP